MFYSRIPCPVNLGYSEESHNRSTKYYPLAGIIVAAIASLAAFISFFVFPYGVTVAITMATTIFITGSFHEDGFADMCDGFGGGWDKRKILDIMKDSRIGTYGAVGLISMLGMKYVTLSSFRPALLVPVLIAGHGASRAMPVLIIRFMDYARENEDSKAKPVAKKLCNSDFAVALAIGLAPLAWLIFANKSFIPSLVLLPMIAATILLGSYFKKWIDGYTGDCLGATQQINEILFYMYFLAISTRGLI